ncbi:DUF1963 domain-containing protein [Aquimarina sp. BL5]|uniref:DUF1963 domain-containing protein n=1 Tax=Aquimarina sp. BL5 TaxID=1714860 RepID=UPI000E4F0092|nr:DUF1963 domain-containing protein [Aquimarina sp. BL5]AXT50893.1 DUF1963 domain-containing protein [Aquimarina sp. BL5]RKN05592.1 DUF1963 domain-containing protein [Aquimarina sp. BL5]
MQEYFKINNIDVGFANHSTEGTMFTRGSLNTEVIIRKGKLRISLLTPALEIADDMHNDFLSDPYYDNLRNIDYLRMVTYSDLEVETGTYNTQIKCPYSENLNGFEVYGFPERVKFHGIIDLQEGYVHIKGELKSEFDEKKPGIPIEVLKCFDPKPLLPKRKQYTLEQARDENPLDVYSLSIGKGVFTKFPEEILAFKNLENLWIGGQAQSSFSTLPDSFFELKELHTIQIYSSDIDEISEKIDQLQKLEELTIRSAYLRLLPDTICNLSKLSLISFEYNQLIDLPKNIGLMPSLKELNVIGNEFKKLPKNLTNIYNVKIDRKHIKLYQEIGYKSDNPLEIDEILYDLSQYPEQKAELEKLILKIPELKEYKNLILDYSTLATYLVLNTEQKEIPIGVSKVGGGPDLPKDWEHPANKNGLLYIFHAQINCKEIAAYQQYLPRKGMLYFFINDEEYAQNPIVLYAENIKELVRFEYSENTEFTDNNFDSCPRSAVAVTFRNAISVPVFYNSFNHGTERYPKYASLWEGEDTDEANRRIEFFEEYMEQLEDSIDTPLALDSDYVKLTTHSIHSSVFTQHESPQEIAAAKFGGEPTEWVVLLNMESVDEFSFWDAGTLTYCIHKKDLAIKDFSKISASIESS